MGFNRQYFSKKGSFGTTLLNLAQLHLVEQIQGQSARPKFDSLVVEDGWNPVNDITLEYYNENNKKIEKNQSLKRNLEDLEFQDTATLPNLLFDFATRYESTEVDSTDKYFALLKDIASHCD